MLLSGGNSLLLCIFKGLLWMLKGHFGGLAHSLSSGGNPFPFKGVLLSNFVALVLQPAEKCSLLLPQQ